MTVRSGGSPQLFFRAEADLQKAIKRAAEEDHRTVSDYLRLIVLQEIERRGLLPKRKRRPGRMPRIHVLGSQPRGTALDDKSAVPVSST